jgi:predicted transcriptional regulator
MLKREMKALKDAERRRDRHDIVAEILKTAMNGKIKTHIMYRAKLSYSQINEYLPMLVGKGFLENTKVLRGRQITAVYRTTPKGLQFIENLESINKLWAKDLAFKDSEE